MTATSCALRSAGLGLVVLLTACSRDVDIDFAQPFPTQGRALQAFPRRHQGRYVAADTTKALFIGPRAVWRQEWQQQILTRHELDSLHISIGADSTYQEASGQRHRLQAMRQGRMRDSWLWADTVFSLAGERAGLLRRFHGYYYLNKPDDRTGTWQVQRLEVSGRRLTWQTLGQDSLRLQVLDPGIVQRRRHKGVVYFHLSPTTGQQARRLGRAEELWPRIEEYQRQ